MSWQTDDGLHEGYAAHITRDGRETHATTGAGLIMSVDHTDVLPWSELLGWEARCTCGWVGSMWRRRDDDQQDATDVRLGADRTVEDDVLDQWERHLADIGHPDARVPA